MAQGRLVADKVCPLLNAGLAAMGQPPKEVRVAANQCREDCQWYIQGKCAVLVIAGMLSTISMK